MKSATINDIKKELNNIPQGRIKELILHLAKYKKENKELLTYLLFEKDDEYYYIKVIKEDVDAMFININSYSTYHSTKSLRKILRLLNKYIKFSGNKQTEAELLIYFCRKLKNSGFDMENSVALANLYYRQLEKIQKAISTLHEDLRGDYEGELEEIANYRNTV
jgi:hypothetical protein